ncbi:Phosphatase YidA [Fructilactobacillus florum 8D]|uniref:Phosphatase YidA n=1 Tax=Fructilactobacillus florum 8D TaxID=1221538 RepID=W9EGQ4_9LACO|nr:sugar-phosphatase [Fructilactobacillus florum]EKK20117.1 Phosphatase YidA [Fructilactobacillus florum 2F]ETO40411.1 Phosphatase YidA [Fructilactobacillus florum 8D]
MNQIKLVAIDVDGTLLNENNELAPETIAAVKQARAAGAKIVICSGRPLSGIHPYLDPLEISGDQEYAIAFNGAVAETVSGKILFQDNVNYEDYLEVEMMAREMGVHFQIEAVNGIYVLNRDISLYSSYESQLVSLAMNYRAPEEITREYQICKLMFVDEPAKIDAANHNLPLSIKERMNVVKSTPVFLEFMNKRAGKGNALEQLTKSLGLTPENVMAIGDQENDLSMIKYAGLGVAMGNGIDDVKQNAQFITKTNRENGVAFALDKFVTNRDQ